MFTNKQTILYREKQKENRSTEREMERQRERERRREREREREYVLYISLSYVLDEKGAERVWARKFRLISNVCRARPSFDLYCIQLYITGKKIT